MPGIIYPSLLQNQFMVGFIDEPRASGILAHITSLPSPYGIGDLESAAATFLPFLVEAGQKYWQILPTGPTSRTFDSSPYMSTSAFAGSPLLLSPKLLYQDGYLTREQLQPPSGVSSYLTRYRRVTRYKLEQLSLAWNRTRARLGKQLERFRATTPWLDDYALFMTFKERYAGQAWYQWPREIACRQPDALAAARSREQERYGYFLFEQYLFSRQWQFLRAQAEQVGISIIGDIPIYIGLDSADVWAHQDIFELSPKTLKPLRISGVPPDYFSKTGQRWGNPLYRWNDRDPAVQSRLLDWWTARFQALFELVDVARIDHFRGFESYWAIPETEETAITGKWVKGPGAPFFRKISERLGPLDIIAEDLGDISTEVIALREQLGYPGMKVLQFAFDGNPRNSFLPYNFETPSCVVYTGTHDNDTTLGWFLSDQLDETARRQVKHHANRRLDDGSEIHRDLIYLALSSIAGLAVIPLQDVLGFGSDCRMNTPGIPTGNWRWRCAPEFLNPETARWLRDITHRFGR